MRVIRNVFCSFYGILLSEDPEVKISTFPITTVAAVAGTKLGIQLKHQ